MRGPRRNPKRVLGQLARGHAPDLHQRAQTGLAGAPKRHDALAHDAAVLAAQRHEVADRGERGQIDVIGGLGRVATRRAEQRLAQLQHHTRGAQLRAAVVAERRVNDRAVGQLVAGPVVVGDHHVEPRSTRGGHLLDRGDAAVHRDQQLDPTPAQPLDRRTGQPVALVEAARQLPDRVGTEGTQGPQQHRGGADAVHVVVAEHGDHRAALDVAEDQLTGRRNARQGERVVRLLGREKAPSLLHIAETTAREDRADDRRDAQPLGQPPTAGDLIRIAPPARRLRLHPIDTALRGGRNARAEGRTLVPLSARRRGSGRGRCRARGPCGRRTSRRSPGRSSRPGWRSAPE